MATRHPTQRQRIQRPAPMYLQVAQEIAQEIRAGDYQPGDRLPSEAQMVASFGVGKATVRQAIAEVRAMGLIDVHQGKGSIVRGPAVQAVEVDRTIFRTGKKWSVPQPGESEKPTITRTSLDGVPAALLAQPDQDAISVEQMIRDPATDTRMAWRLFIPLSVAASTPVLAEDPAQPIADHYQALAEAGHTLSWEEHVTARTPYPDERSALRLRDTSPLMITYRVTSGTDARPLLCEELRVPATARLRFPLNATKAPAKSRTRKA
ncbi:GntR family transcriptional regulator [Streptomyces cacaoi]|uniref:GntR family transcriptional regulator n=1 Tax=Streptomyces cacaoi TaxID=1898 RepID=UPI00263661CC|nr:GntR family transcriptional regulator [Streptomyces cacaoi]